MWWRYKYLTENKSIGVNETTRFDLPKYGNLGSILFRLSGAEETGLGQSGGKWRLMDFIDKIQILGGGSYPIKSLTAKQLAANGFWDERVMPMGTWRNYATNVQFEYFLLNFGQYLYDTNMGLDLGHWDNVELQITTSASGAEFSDIALSAQQCFLEDAGVRPFAGFLRSEQWRQWTTVADETKDLILDTEYKIRRLAIEAIADVDASNISETGISNLADNVLFQMDTGKVTMYEGGLDDIINLNYYNYGAPVITGGFPYHFADVGVDMGIGYVHAAVVGGGSQSGGVAASIPTIESGRTDTTQKLEVYDADNPVGLITMGKAPFGQGLFRFDYDYDPSTWLDPNLRKQVELHIHTRNQASAADGSLAIILDRFVPY